MKCVVALPISMVNHLRRFGTTIRSQICTMKTRSMTRTNVGVIDRGDIINRGDVIDRVRKRIINDNRIKYLKKDGVIEWLMGDDKLIKTMTKSSENKWGRGIIQSNTSQWTTKLGESVLFELLTLHNKNPKRITVGKVGANKKRLMPDFEADDGIYENKARTYTTTGTAGEKILGTPVKYSECKRLYKKPVYIVCMGYQEKEAEDIFQVFKPKSKELKKILEFYEKEIGIKFIKASDLLKDL